MRQKRTFLYLSGIACGIGMALAFVNPYNGRLTLAELILQLSGSRGEFCLGFSLPELVGLTARMLPYYILMMSMGNHIYSSFCTASVYIFSRCPNRLRWYKRELRDITINMFIFVLVFTLSTIFTTMIRYQIIVDSMGILIAVYHVLTYTIWVILWVLICNILAIQKGSSDAFLVVMILQVILITSLGIVNLLIISGVSKEQIENILWINPISHIILGWHSGTILKEELVVNSYSLDMLGSATILIILCVTAVVWGGVVINKKELLTENVETETI